MIRRACRALAALCLAAIPFALTHSAEADSADAFGWWYQLNDGALLVAPPPPPDAPSGGIYVQGSLTGPSAYGALRFTNTSATAGVITLAVEGTTGAVEVALCPTTTGWLPADGGVWQKRPEFDCAAAKALGVIAADGKRLTFQVTDAFAKAGDYDLAIVPDPTAQTVFSLSLTAPGPDLFTMTSSTPPTLPPVTTPPPDPTSFDPGAGSTFGAPVPSFSGSTDVGSFLDPPTTTAVAETPTTESTGRPDTRLAVRPVAHRDTTAQRLGAGIGLAAMAGALWFAGNRRSSDLTPELVKAGAISAHGGIGRFARVRTASPTQLT